jgi:hypothetical protein
MTVEKMFPSGGYRVSEIVNGYYVTMRYFGYTKKEAVRLFRQYIKEIQ